MPAREPSRRPGVYQPTGTDTEKNSMLKKSLLAATCLVTMTSMASAASIKSESTVAGSQQLAAAEMGARHASQGAAMLRASEFIGETVRNGKGEKVGSVDDLILNRGDKVLYAVISVGGFLGIGDKLVAVPFDELKLGSKDVSGAIVYDTTKEQLKTQPAFTYADAGGEASRESYLRSAERQVDRWQGRIDKGVKDAKSNAQEMKKGASERIDSAWKKVQAQWVELKNSSADAWGSAKKKFDNAMGDLEKAWDDATS
jgi:sporulation protein YlmC with PRC-barrel domain